MALLRLGKAREATTQKGEDYKVDVRAYMKSLGFAQTTDSAVEAHRQDMVLVPMDDRPARQEQWVEAKNTELSVTDSHFASEVKSYLADWLIKRDAARFRLWVFVKKLKNPDKWHTIFGDDLSEEAVAEWLKKTNEASVAAQKRIAAADFSLVVSFFSEIQVVEADAAALRDSIADRSRTGRSVIGSAQWARDLAAAMEKRARPLAARTHVFANLVRFQPPPRYVELEIEPRSLDEIKEAFRGQPRSPFGVLDKNRILAVDTENVETEFSPLYGAIANRLDLDEVESLYEPQLMSLLNRGLSSIVHWRGVKWGGTCYYFLADNDVSRGKPRVIKALRTHLTVASPKPIEETTAEESGDVEYMGDLRMRMPGTGRKRLNYVFHEGFNVRCVRLWDDYFVRLHLHRAFTEDGRQPLPGDRAAKLDEKFRAPEMNRADSQARKLELIAAYLFDSKPASLGSEPGRGPPPWSVDFRFPGLLRVPIMWEPERVDLRDSTLFDELTRDTEEETDDGS